MKHKHAELIKAWADGAEIECKHPWSKEWIDADVPSWNNDIKYRIKPEPKPDVVRTFYILEHLNGQIELCEGFHEIPNLKLVWDGATSQLKSAEVLK
jgi:hypothetical protein